MTVPVADPPVPAPTGLGSLGPFVIPGEPKWLTGARHRAAERVRRDGFPTRKHEDWRYFDLRPAFELPVTHTGEEPGRTALATAKRLLGPGLGGARLVFVNGYFTPSLSPTDGLTSGVRVVPLSQLAGAAGSPGGAGEVLHHLWSVEGGGERHGFDALNAALAVDGAIVELPEGATVEAPIEVVYVSVADDGVPLSSLRSLVLAGARSTATVVETFVGAGASPSMTNAFTKVLVGEGAHLDHYTVQDEPGEAIHLSTLELHPERAGSVSSHLLALGGRLARHEVRVRLAAEGSSAELDGLYLPGGSQCHDNPVLVEHAAPGCASRQLYKGIIDGSARGVFNGHVVVHPGADGTDAHQVNKNLLLAERAEADTRPRLEIFADDVACTHGAAVGQLDRDALFYLRSRGIPEPAARALLISGFAREVLDRYQPPVLRQRAEALVDRHLGRADVGVPSGSAAVSSVEGSSEDPGKERRP
ncbi:MAG: Fe-S cluster assembly protein SufD [Acidimicrobiales bacterium]